jgi:hypothetical protein
MKIRCSTFKKFRLFLMQLVNCYLDGLCSHSAFEVQVEVEICLGPIRTEFTISTLELYTLSKAGGVLGHISRKGFHPLRR